MSTRPRPFEKQHWLWKSAANFASLTCVCAVLTIALAAGPTAKAVTLFADFDQGSLDVAGSSMAGSTVTLAGRDNYNTGDWKWLYFGAADVQNESLVFRIDDNFETGGGNLVDHEMVYSYDQQSWSFFDNNVRSASADTYTFWNNQPFSAPTVYVAYGLPYPVSRAVGHTQSIATSPWVVPTASANASLVLGQSPGGTDDLGRTISPNDLYGYRIVDPVGATERQEVVLASGVHANETLGNYALEGLVDFLVGSDLEAGLLRKYADFHVYPMVNPDGRIAGYNRSTVSNETQDPNRYWLPNSYGGIPELQTVGSAMIADTEGADYVIDFHSTVNGKSGHYGYVHPTMQGDPLWQAFLTLEPNVDTRDAVLSDDTLAKFGRDVLGANFSITLETQFIAGEQADRFLDMGRNWGLALADTFVTWADFNLDGVLNADDYQILITNSEADLTGMGLVDAYLLGDLDGDGRNSIADFGLFKNAYEAAWGVGTFGSLTTAVPEPSATAVLATAFMTLAVLRYFFHQFA